MEELKKWLFANFENPYPSEPEKVRTVWLSCFWLLLGLCCFGLRVSNDVFLRFALVGLRMCLCYSSTAFCVFPAISRPISRLLSVNTGEFHAISLNFEQKDLARRLGLKVEQVNYWFINARVRIWRPMISESPLASLWCHVFLDAKGM